MSNPILESDPVALATSAHLFAGLCANAVDLMTTQARFLLCKPQRNRERPPTLMEPQKMLGLLVHTLPAITPVQLQKTFPDSALLRQQSPRTALGDSAEYVWFDFIIYARMRVIPTKPEALEPIMHGYFVIGYNPDRTKFAVEVIDAIYDVRHLLVQENESVGDFSSGVAFYVSKNEILPRLAKLIDAAPKTESPPAPAFAIGCTMVNDLESRAVVIAFPGGAS